MRQSQGPHSRQRSLCEPFVFIHARNLTSLARRTQLAWHEPISKPRAIQNVEQIRSTDTLPLAEEAAKPVKDSQDEVQQDAATFVWRDNWYPIAVASYLKRNRPNQLVILNEELIVWFGEDQQWHAAPKFDAQKYHEGQSAGNGTGKDSPQSIAVPRACLDTFPTKVAQGIIWVWPQLGTVAVDKSNNRTLPIYEDASQPGMMSSDSDFFYLNAPMDWYLALENFMDPSHAPCLHEGLTGNRKDMVHMDMDVTQIHPTQGIRLEHGSYTKIQQAMQMKASRECIPPCQMRSEYAFSSGIKNVSVLYITPEAPGSCHIFGKFFMGGAKEAFAIAPVLGGQSTKWTQHITALKKRMVKRVEQSIGLSSDIPLHTAYQDLSNQDLLVFSHSELYMGRSEASKQASKCKTPARLSSENYCLDGPADRGVAALWSWVEKFGGEPDWSTLRPFKGPSVKDRKALFSHYERHTRHCPKCLHALERLQTSAKILQGAMMLVLAAALIFPRSIVVRAALVASAGLCHRARAWALGKQLLFYGRTLLPDEKGPEETTCTLN